MRWLRVSKVHPGLRTCIRQPWTRAIAVDGWEMLSVNLIIECLVGVASTKQKKWLPLLWVIILQPSWRC